MNRGGVVVPLLAEPQRPATSAAPPHPTERAEDGSAMTDGIWARIDVEMLYDPKVRQLSAESKVIFLAAILHSRRNLTDGYLTESEVCQLIKDHLGDLGKNPSRALPRRYRRATGEILSVGLFVAVGDTPDAFLIPAYARWQETRATIEKRRKDTAQRVARHRERQARRPSPNGLNGLFGRPP